MTSTWLFSKLVSQSAIRFVRKNLNLDKNLFISQLFITLESSGLGQEALERRRREMWQTGKELIWLGVRGGEENFRESMKLKWRGQEDEGVDIFESRAFKPVCAFGDVSLPWTISPYTLSFLPLRLVYLLPFPSFTCYCSLHICFSSSLLLPKQS